MVLKRLRRLLMHPAPFALIGSAADCPQSILLTSEALWHVFDHRQTSARSTEAGGQLFGHVDNDRVHVICATGPYPDDERTRYRYRSNPLAAQRAIEIQNRAGLLYLGEWHTHAEDFPTASALDHDAMQRLMSNSSLNSNALLMLIVGRSVESNGLALFSISVDRTQAWILARSNI